MPAVKSTTSLMLECAEHFETKGELDKAIQLYHKGGDLTRALDLCFRAAGESIHICTHIHIHLYTHTFTYTHTNTYTHPSAEEGAPSKNQVSLLIY